MNGVFRMDIQSRSRRQVSSLEQQAASAKGKTMTKKSALATGFTVDLTALNSNAQTLLATPGVATSTKPQASSGRRQAPSDSSSRQQASSDEQQAASAKPRASSSSI